MRRRLMALGAGAALAAGLGAVPMTATAGQCPPILMFARASVSVPDGPTANQPTAVNPGGLGCTVGNGPDTRVLQPGATQVSVATTATPTQFDGDGNALFDVDFLVAGDVVASVTAPATYNATNERWTTPYLDMHGADAVRASISIVTGQTIVSTYRSVANDVEVGA